ncbi:MAG: exosortase/archaeosortase family protein [candidate division Zixibacteria bacterium]|nr:exosortase/archaeosortase family protein [candidate division Zixibacteria bacterium]
MVTADNKTKIEFDKNLILQHLKTHKFIYILIATLLLLNIRLFEELIYDWSNDDNYTHGFLIIPISIYLFFKQRKSIKLPAPPSKLGIAIFVIGSIFYILGIAASEYFTLRTSLVIIITGLGYYYLGYENFKKVWFAFAFLMFMIPIPSVIYYTLAFPLQIFATDISVSLLEIIGVPALNQGNIIYLPEYTLEVAEACSGLRSLTSLLALSALYGNIAFKGKLKPTIIFLSAIPIAIVANIFRLIFTVIGAYAISTSFAEDFLHELSGMFVFGFALIAILIWGSILKWTGKNS